MKKKLFFIVGLAISAVAASLLIPMQDDGSSWWSANFNAPVVTVIDVDRYPAGGNPEGEPFPAEGPEPTPPPEFEEEEPVFTGTDKGGGKDYVPAPEQPVYEPAPEPQAPAMNCIQKAFTEPPKKANGQYTRSWIRGVNMSPEYIDMFRRSAQKQFGTGKNSLRASITGLVAAGYCPQKQSYRSAFNLSAKDVIPMVHGKAATANLDQRMQAWRANPNTRAYRCSRDSFKEIRKNICEKIYQNCNLRMYSAADCRMADRSGKDNDDRGGNNNGGNNNGGGNDQKEVGDGNNKDSGHEGNRDGGHGEGPPGSSR